VRRRLLTHCLRCLAIRLYRVYATECPLRIVLGKQCPRLFEPGLGTVERALRHHSIDLFTLLQPLSRLLSRFLRSMLLRQILGLVQRVLGIGNAALRWCQGPRVLTLAAAA